MRTWIILLGLLAGQDSEPAPVPEAPALKEAEKLIKDLFKEEYAARAPADRILLAKKLAEQAEATKDDAAVRYALLRESTSVAAAACDVRLALKSADRLVKTFKTDAVLFKSETLQALIKSAKTVDEASQIAAAYLKLSKEATDVDDFAGAEKAVSGASAQAKKAQNTILANRAAVRTKEVADLKGKYDKVRKMKETLAASPEDPTANFEVGQYECFSKSDWVAGLAHLAKGSDAALKDLAARDLAGAGAPPPEQAAIGDGWWDLGEKKTPARDEARRRAAFWYEKALPKLTGLSLTKTDKRLFELRGEVLGHGTWVDVSDPKQYGQNGKVLAGTTGRTLRLTKPPEGEFDGLTLRFKVAPGTAAPEFRIEYEVDSRAIYIFMNQLQSNVLDKNTWNYEVSRPCPPKEEFLFHVLITDGEYVGYMDRKEFFRAPTGRETLTAFEIVCFKPKPEDLSIDQIKLRRRQ
jgi:hypothetical protein